MPPTTPPESLHVRPENHIGFAIAAASFSAVIARLYTEQAARKALKSLERARSYLRQTPVGAK